MHSLKVFYWTDFAREVTILNQPTDFHGQIRADSFLLSDLLGDGVHISRSFVAPHEVLQPFVEFRVFPTMKQLRPMYSKNTQFALYTQ